MAYFVGSEFINQRLRASGEQVSTCGVVCCENVRFSYRNPLGSVNNPSGLKFVETITKSQKIGLAINEFPGDKYLLEINGFSIEAYKLSEAWYGNFGQLFRQMSLFSSDCHGITFTNGEYWINNDQVPNILNSGIFKKINSYPHLSQNNSPLIPQVVWENNNEIIEGDIIVYYGKGSGYDSEGRKDYGVVHTVTVGTDDKGEYLNYINKLNIPVIGKGGNLADIYGRDCSDKTTIINGQEKSIKDLGETIGTAWQGYTRIEIWR